MVGRSVVGKGAVGPQDAHQRKIRLVVRYEKAEPTHGVAYVLAPKSQVEHHQRRALNGAQNLSGLGGDGVE